MNFDDVFLNHRTCYNFLDKQIPESLLQEIYDIVKSGPTSFNSSPLRVVFVTSAEEKNKILECLMPANVEKTRSAPVTAIFAYDLHFYTKLTKLSPHAPNLSSLFVNNEALSFDTAFRNSSLQAAYFMLASRSRGIDCGPMSGFNTDMVNEKFFNGTNFKVNFLCNLGYKKEGQEYDKSPRLDFNEVCKFI
jgi:nitroreductase